MEKRKLAAIMFTDIVGFSLKMGEDEETTMGMLERHNEIMEGLVERYEGKILKKLGDGLLIEFGSSVKAVKCALEVQKELQKYNEDKEELEKIILRIGIELGDIIIKGDDIFGDGVNVASRINGQSEPGGICISENIYKNVKNKMLLEAEGIGAPRLKNIKEPIKLYKIRTGGEVVSEEKKKEKEEILMEFRVSRKAFWVEYGCGLFLLGLMGFLYYKRINLGEGISYFALGLAFFSLASAEVSRRAHRCEVTPSKLVIVNGLIRRNKKHIYMKSISDIDVRQGLVQRLLNYGVIHIKSASGESSLEIRDIDEPERRMEELEEIIEKYKNN